MLRLIPFFFVLISAISASGQDQLCKDVKKGKFEIITPETGTTHITRAGNEQRERNKTLGYDVIFSVVWTDECTYELRPKKLIKGNPSIMGDGNDVIYNTITEISENHYTVSVTSNFFLETFQFEVLRR